MAVSITFSFTTPQQNRIVAAKDIYNEQQGTTLTPKQYLLTVIKDAVKSAILTDIGDSAENAALAGLDSDLTGDA